MKKEIIFNVKTGETTEIDFTEKELKEFQAKQAKAEAQRLTTEHAEAEKQALKDSANAKLEALGLSPEEISAITGA